MLNSFLGLTLLYTFINLMVILAIAIILMDKNKLNFQRIVIFALCYITFVGVRLIANYSQFLYFTVPWGSRLLAIVFGIICFFLFRRFFRNSNYFRIKQEKGNTKLILLISIITIVGYSIVFILRGYPQEFSIEELLFYSIAVELEEEIIFRGLLLGLLMSCLGKKILFIKYPAVLLCGLFFGFYHGNFFYFDYINIITNCVFGYIVGWIAVKTKSIFVPLLVHSLTNCIGYLIQVFYK